MARLLLTIPMLALAGHCLAALLLSLKPALAGGHLIGLTQVCSYDRGPARASAGGFPSRSLRFGGPFIGWIICPSVCDSISRWCGRAGIGWQCGRETANGHYRARFETWTVSAGHNVRVRDSRVLQGSATTH